MEKSNAILEASVFIKQFCLSKFERNKDQGSFHKLFGGLLANSPVPRDDGLERPVRTTPPIIVEAVLHVVVIGVDPVDQAYLAARD